MIPLLGKTFEVEDSPGMVWGVFNRMLKWVYDLLMLLEWVIWPIGAMRGSLGHTFTIMLTFTLSMKKF